MVVYSTEYQQVMRLYQHDDEEILVLFSDTGGDAGRIKDARLRTASADFIAYKILLPVKLVRCEKQPWTETTWRQSLRGAGFRNLTLVLGILKMQ